MNRAIRTRRRVAAAEAYAPGCGAQRGFALVLVLLLTTAMLALGVLGSLGVQIETRIASNDLTSKQAQAAAAAGANHAYRLVKDLGQFSVVASTHTDGSLTGIGGLRLLDGKYYRFAPFGGNGSGDGYYVRAENGYQVSPQQIKIISRGRTGGAERIVDVLLDANPPALNVPWALYAKAKATIGGGSTIDSYSGVYDPSMPRSNANIASDAADSPCVDIQDTLSTVRGNGTFNCASINRPERITGTKTYNTEPNFYGQDPINNCGTWSSSAGLHSTGGLSYDQSTGVLTQSGGSGVLTLDPGHYCFNQLTLSGGSTLQINGQVVISVSGRNSKIDFGGGIVDNTTLVPANAQFYSNCSKDCVTLSGAGPRAYGIVHAPNSNVTFSTGGNFYGAILGNNVTVSGGSQLHYDESLSSSAATSGAATLVAWHEVRNP